MRKILALLFVGIFLFGAEYGRITGKVVDTETNKPLVGADIIVEGTELGGATDENGEFVILYVPVGTYNVVASYISYEPFTFTDVVVSMNQTPLLGFRLQGIVIGSIGPEEIIVTVERPKMIRSINPIDRPSVVVTDRPVKLTYSLTPILDVPGLGKVEADLKKRELVFICYNPGRVAMEYSILAGNTYTQSEAGGWVSEKCKPAVKRESLPHYKTFMVTIARYEKIGVVVCRENAGRLGVKVIE